MATSTSLSHNANKLETAKLLASKCDPIPWEAASTYYTRLWNTKFRQIQGKVDINNGLNNAYGDNYNSSVIERLINLAQKDQCFKREYWNDDSTPEARPGWSVTTDKEVKEILGSARLTSESLNIPDALTIFKCVAERDLDKPHDNARPISSAEISFAKRFLDQCQRGSRTDFTNRNALAKLCLINKSAGSCELIVKVYSKRFSSEPDSKPYLPFDVPTTVALVGELDLPLRWLSARGDDSGSFYREEDTDTIRYCFQSPFYTHGSWNLTFCVRRPTGDLGQLINYADASYARTFKTVGLLEVDQGIDLASMFDEIYLSADRCCNPLVLPFRLFEHHVQESGRNFMRVSKKLAGVEQAIDLSLSRDPPSSETGVQVTRIAERPYGKWSKIVYECSTELFDLERRRNFEYRLQIFLSEDLSHHRWAGDDLDEMKNWLATIEASSSTRDFDIKSLPRRIEALTSLIRNLVTQQDSQANIQIARSTMQENIQMTALTKASVDIANQTKVLGIATLKDSNAMKNIAILTTIFLPGTYIASLFSTTMFNFSDPSHLQVSNHIWLYWVITIPLTIIVFSSLQGLIKYRDHLKKEANEEVERKV